MIARALVALGGATLTDQDRAAGRLAELVRREYAGEGETWEAAKTAAGVPEDGLVLYWAGGPRTE